MSYYRVYSLKWILYYITVKLYSLFPSHFFRNISERMTSVKKQLICLLLILLSVLSLLSACASEPAAVPDGTSAPAAASDNSADSADNSADTADSSSPSPIYTNGYVSFPLETPETVSMFLIMDFWSAPIYASMAEHPVLVEIGDRLNLNLDIVSPSFFSATEQLNLALAAEEYTDVMTNFNSSSASMLLENELSLDLTEYVPTHMPNYYSLITSDTELLRECTNDDGSISLIRSIYKDRPLSANGLGIRSDLLAQTGLEKPTNVMELEPVLAAFRDMGMEYPYFLYSTGRDSFIQSAFDLPSNNFYVEGDTVKYAPLEENFKEYLTLMNQWYEAGYIHSDYVGVTDTDILSYLLQGSYGVGIIDSSSTGDQLATASGIDGWYLDTFAPLSLDGTTPNRVKASDGSGRLNMYSYFVTPVAEDHLDVVLSMLDYFYTEEGYLLCSYGIEGETLLFNEEGEPEYNFDIINTSTYDNVSTFHVYSKAMWVFPCLINDKEISLGRADVYVQLQSVWGSYEGDIFNLPGAINMTVEEQETYSAAATDAATYTEEMVAKFIMGIEDIETGFEDFRQALLAFGIEDALAAQQSAYDRYVNR